MPNSTNETSLLSSLTLVSYVYAIMYKYLTNTSLSTLTANKVIKIGEKKLPKEALTLRSIFFIIYSSTLILHCAHCCRMFKCTLYILYTRSSKIIHLK